MAKERIDGAVGPNGPAPSEPTISMMLSERAASFVAAQSEAVGKIGRTAVLALLAQQVESHLPGPRHPAKDAPQAEQDTYKAQSAAIENVYKTIEAAKTKDYATVHQTRIAAASVAAGIAQEISRTFSGFSVKFIAEQ